MLIAYVIWLVHLKGTWKPYSSDLCRLDYADMESLVLEEEAQQVLRAPTEVQEAWEQGSQQQMWLFLMHNCEKCDIRKSLKSAFFL